MTDKKKKPAKHKKAAPEHKKEHEEVKKEPVVEEASEKKESDQTVVPEPQSMGSDSKPEETKEEKPFESNPQPVGQSGVLSDSPVKEQGSAEETPKTEEVQTSPPVAGVVAGTEPGTSPASTEQSQSSSSQSSNQAENLTASNPELPTGFNPNSQDLSAGKVESVDVVSQDQPADTGDTGVVRDKEVDDGSSGGGSKKGKLWLIIVIVIIILVILGGVLWYFRENVIKGVSLPSGVSTPSPTLAQVAPTPASESAMMEIDYSEYAVQVLNGSGISGLAGDTQGILESEEFVVDSIGNADASDYVITVIQAKQGVPEEYIESLRSLLEDTYVVQEDVEELDDAEDVDVIVIVGSEES